MIKVAQAMDTIAMHACPTCLDEDFGFGLTASTDWEVRQLKPVPPHPFPAPQPQQQQPWPWPVARSPMSLALSPHAPRPKQVELKLVDDRIIAINSAIAATVLSTQPQVSCPLSPPPPTPPPPPHAQPTPSPVARIRASWQPSRPTAPFTADEQQGVLD